MKLFDDAETNRRFSRMQWRMLFATMIGYTLFYFMRKNFSDVPEDTMAAGNPAVVKRCNPANQL